MSPSVIAGYAWDHTPPGLRAAIAQAVVLPQAVISEPWYKLNAEHRAKLVERMRQELAAREREEKARTLPQ